MAECNNLNGWALKGWCCVFTVKHCSARQHCADVGDDWTKTSIDRSVSLTPS